MRSRKLALLGLLCLASTTVFAQDLGGTWQGTLSIQGNTLRVVFQVTKAGDGKFSYEGAFSADGNAISNLSADIQFGPPDTCCSCR